MHPVHPPGYATAERSSMFRFVENSCQRQSLSLDSSTDIFMSFVAEYSRRKRRKTYCHQLRTFYVRQIEHLIALFRTCDMTNVQRIRPRLSNSPPMCRVVRPKFHLARLDSTRLDTFDFVERVEPCCFNMADEEQAIVVDR